MVAKNTINIPITKCKIFPQNMEGHKKTPLGLARGGIKQRVLKD